MISIFQLLFPIFSPLSSKDFFVRFPPAISPRRIDESPFPPRDLEGGGKTRGRGGLRIGDWAEIMSRDGDIIQFVAELIRLTWTRDGGIRCTVEQVEVNEIRLNLSLVS